MRGDVHVRFCESAGVRFPRATHLICFSLDQLDYIKTTWVAYYNTLRPHRGIGMNNDVLDETFRPQLHGVVRCKRQLGGIIKSYHREAA